MMQYMKQNSFIIGSYEERIKIRSFFPKVYSLSDLHFAISVHNVMEAHNNEQRKYAIQSFRKHPQDHRSVH